MLRCPFHMLTGLDCPMCGGQRMVVALWRGRVWEAFLLNPFLFVAIPAVALWWWHAGRFSPRAAFVLFVLTMVWGVVRNAVTLWT